MTRNLALCVVVALVAAFACKRDRPRPAEQPSDLRGEPRQPDPALREAVWTELERSRAVPLDRVVVRVDGGEVTLDGTVDTLAQRAWAEELASRAFGVTAVDNDLEVVTRARPDDELRVAVEEALEADPLTRGRGLEVSTTGGAVRLQGTVARGPERFAASAVVERVPGVAALTNDIEVVPPSRPDDEIRADIQDALAWERGLGSAPVVAHVEGGQVRLAGTVDNVFAANLAAASAWVAGVRSVDASGLRVLPRAPASPPVAVAPSVETLPDVTAPAPVEDPAIAEAVVRSFGNDPALATGQVVPEVAAGVVTLRGEVASAVAARAAEERALRIRGVTSVDNQLVVAPAAPVADSQIAAEVQSVLSGDADLAGAPITVEVVDGVATLQGSVESAYHELLARHIVAARSGVVAVQSRLEVPATPGANLVQPSTTGVQPSTTGVQPSTTAPQPFTTGTQPSTTGVQPATAPVQPTTTGARPSTTGVQPGTTRAQPSTTGVQPATTGAQPSTTGVQPGTTRIQPSTTRPAPPAPPPAPRR